MTTIKSIKVMAESLLEQRTIIDELKKKLETAQSDKDAIQSDLLMTLEKEGLKSLKTDTHTFASVSKLDPRVIDEEAVLAELDKRGLKDEVLITKLDTLKVKQFARQLLKESGEVLAGTEPFETIYISIKTN